MPRLSPSGLTVLAHSVINVTALSRIRSSPVASIEARHGVRHCPMTELLLRAAPAAEYLAGRRQSRISSERRTAHRRSTSRNRVRAPASDCVFQRLGRSLTPW